MADEIIRLDYSAEDIGDNIDEVRTARGTFDTLDDRLDNIEGGGPSPSNPIASNCVSPMTGYSKSSSSTPGNISTDDTLNAAIGKLEKRTELNENNISSVANVGVKNLCKPNVSADSEVTAVVNADLSITVTCNTTALRDVCIFTDLSGLTDGKDYILSGCSGGDYSNTYGFAVRTSSSVGKAFESDGETTFTKTAEMVKMDLIIRAGQNWTKTFYPMIRPAYISDSTYQQYAMSNAELTEEVRQIGGIKLVAHTSNNGNTSLSYDTNINDFYIGANTDKNSGVYLIVCNNWSTTPAPYIGLLTFSGATTNHFVKTDIVTGFAPTISITENTANATIDISGAAKISIYALR